METFLIKALQLILSLSILVLLHEGGHFFFAKLFKTRVEKFCIFFDPWFTPFKFKPKKSDTEYAIGWLPLGGYCKIAGMIDESMDTEQMKQPEQPWEFRSKPAWQRLFIMIGGVLVNFLLAMFIYSMVLFAWGEEYVPMKNITQGFKYNSAAQEIGFRDGDIPVSADGCAFVKYDVDVIRAISEASVVNVLRDGKEIPLKMPKDLSLLDMMKHQPPFMALYRDAVVDSVMPGSPAAEIGLQKNDTIKAINAKHVDSFNEFELMIMRLSDAAVDCSSEDSLRLRKVSLIIARNGKRDTTVAVLTPEFKLGFAVATPDYKTERKEYSFLASFPAGINHGMNVLGGYVSDLKYVFTKDGAKSVGGFGTIGSIFPSVWDWQRFWELTAFLSIILAFMNILPIPALDGGHVLFLLYEIVVRRKPSDKFLERAQIIGMVLLLILMVWANFNDIIRFFF